MTRLAIIAGSIPTCAGKPQRGLFVVTVDAVYPHVRGETGIVPPSTLPRFGLSPRARGNPDELTPKENLFGSIPTCAGKPIGQGDPRRGGGVYPHVRGETLSAWTRRAALAGLSPRARGNPVTGRAEGAWGRSIPTCAGKPSVQSGSGSASGVYPHVRGETCACPVAPVAVPGLSPRARGNRRQLRARQASVGSIPTCAGKPEAPLKRSCRGRVYPHVRGETEYQMPVIILDKGLSPRARGNRLHEVESLFLVGSIPTCAGKPIARCPLRRRDWVYPHVRGETRTRPVPRTARMGLSPRARGNHEQVGHVPETAGSIPTCAGKPLRRHHHQCQPAVYPHVRGETVFASLSHSYEQGLSPRARGNRRPPCASPCDRGSIPTCAGKPFRRRRRHGLKRVYPHVRGETTVAAIAATWPAGLSPRARGNQVKPPMRLSSKGSIPTCAGKPRHRAA